MVAAPDAIVDNALDCWGTKLNTFSPEIRKAYTDTLRDPVRARAICEEYRAAATMDRQHDADDVSAGKFIKCPVFVGWSKDGGLNTWYEEEGGPLALWRKWANDVIGFLCLES
jgi:haloacetate dehalogenase